MYINQLQAIILNLGLQKKFIVVSLVAHIFFPFIYNYTSQDSLVFFKSYEAMKHFSS